MRRAGVGTRDRHRRRPSACGNIGLLHVQLLTRKLLDDTTAVCIVLEHTVTQHHTPTLQAVGGVLAIDVIEGRQTQRPTLQQSKDGLGSLTRVHRGLGPRDTKTAGAPCGHLWFRRHGSCFRW